MLPSEPGIYLAWVNGKETPVKLEETKIGPIWSGAFELGPARRTIIADEAPKFTPRDEVEELAEKYAEELLADGELDWYAALRLRPRTFAKIVDGPPVPLRIHDPRATVMEVAIRDGSWMILVGHGEAVEQYSGTDQDKLEDVAWSMWEGIAGPRRLVINGAELVGSSRMVGSEIATAIVEQYELDAALVQELFGPHSEAPAGQSRMRRSSARLEIRPKLDEVVE